MAAARKSKPDGSAGDPEAQLAMTLELLKSHANSSTLAGMARYAIPSDKAFGVPMNKIQAVAKEVGKSHDLAEALWQSGWYEARTLAAYVDEPGKVTAEQMDRWCRDFDNWAICDTVCFALFDRTPHAWGKVSKWAVKKEEFQRRAAFALLWGLMVHNKAAADARYLEGLKLIEKAAIDERNFVKKAVNMALRATGKRNASLNVAAVATAQRLAGSADATACWIGKHALKELTAPALRKKLGV